MSFDVSDPNGPDFRRLYHGKFKGFVRDNLDPEGRGRVRCYCPQVMGDLDDKDHWLGWAEPCFPWLGGLSILDAGVPMTKAENQGEDVGLWLEFQNGEVDFPIYVGTFVVAPTNDGVHTVMKPAAQISSEGGSLLADPPAGSSGVENFTPPAAALPPGPNGREIRLFSKVGVDIVIGSRDGGFMVIGPNGVGLYGVFVRANGKAIDATLGEVLGLWPESSVSTRACSTRRRT